MNVPRTVLRQYDVRGIVGKELTPDFARALGRAFATAGIRKLRRAPVLAVGRDNRPSGESLAGAFREGIVAAGGTAVDVGLLPTPALYFAVSALKVDGGCQVTGSHNPPEFNGFKMVLAGDSMHGDEIQALWETIATETWETGTGRQTSDGSVLGKYKDAIVSRHKLERPVRVVVDCGNGAGSVIAVPTLQALGAEVIPLFCESDGTFPNHHPDPTVPENLKDLQAEVRRHGTELGIAFDVPIFGFDLWGPPGLPAGIASQITRAMEQAVKDPEFGEVAKKITYQPVFAGPEPLKRQEETTHV